MKNKIFSKLLMPLLTLFLAKNITNTDYFLLETSLTFSTRKEISDVQLNSLILPQENKRITEILSTFASEFVNLKENGSIKPKKEILSLREKFKLNFIMGQLNLLNLPQRCQPSLPQQNSKYCGLS